MESSTVLLVTVVSLSVLVECMETLPELCAGKVNLSDFAGYAMFLL